MTSPKWTYYPMSTVALRKIPPDNKTNRLIRPKVMAEVVLLTDVYCIKGCVFINPMSAVYYYSMEAGTRTWTM